MPASLEWKAKNTATATPAMMLIKNGHSFDSLRSDGEKKQKYEFYWRKKFI